MRPDNENGRPWQDGRESSTPIKNDASLPLTAGSLEELDALAAHVAGAFVVVVEVGDLKYRRRVYLTAKAAENAVHRAAERGAHATAYLAELQPVRKIVAGQAVVA